MKIKRIITDVSSDHGTTMVVTNGGTEDLAYGDIVTITGTIQDIIDHSHLVVRQSSPSSSAIIGVVCQKEGIAAGANGEVQMSGIADVNVVSAVYNTPGQLITIVGGGAGSGAVGSFVPGKVVGWTVGDAGYDAVTQTRVYLNPGTGPGTQNNLFLVGLPREVTEDGSIDATTDMWVDVNCTSGNIALETCDIEDAQAGQSFLLTKTDSSANICTVTDPNGKLFDGEASLVLSMQYQRAWIATDGVNWRVISM
jgi:hypothetical protein